MSKEVFITGGYGSIGGSLFEALCDDERFERVDRLSKNEDICTYDFSKLGKYDDIIHLCGIVGSDACDVAGFDNAFKVNCLGSARVAEFAKSMGARLIYVGTTASSLPLGEQTIYGHTKLYGEDVCKSIMDRQDLLILRICFAYGPHETHSAISKIINCSKNGSLCVLLLDLAKKKDYMYMDDVVEAFKLILADESLHGRMDLSVGKAVPFSEVVTTVAKHLSEHGQTFPVTYYRLEADYLGDHIIDSSEFKHITGWRPKVSLDEGIEKVIAEVFKDD
jgi:nucleoside-diphosphate-sugar epimerase